MRDYIAVLKNHRLLLLQNQQLLNEKYQLQIQHLKITDAQALRAINAKYVGDTEECKKNIEAIDLEIDRLKNYVSTSGY